jgi:LacI family transcriptional regulator
MRRKTMKDVAKRAKVSIATVSRVLNSNYPVSKEIEERVKKAVKELQFRPNSVARSLRMKKSNLIAMVVSDIRNPYYISIARKIDNQLFDSGYSMIVCSTDESVEKEKKILDTIIEKNVDAVVSSPCTQNPETLMPLIKENIFTILIDRDIPSLNLNFIGENNLKEAYLLTEYLINKGHREIAIMNGTLSSGTGSERFIGYCTALQKHSIRLIDDLVLNGGFYKELAYDQMNKLLSDHDSIQPTAIISCNNLMTEGIMEAIFRHHKKIPDDISLVSFGCIENQAFIDTKITYIKQNSDLVGEKAADILLKQMKNELEFQKPAKINIKNPLIEGNSVKDISEANFFD